MKIEHLAIWVENLEDAKTFYTKYFDLSAGEKYTNQVKEFTSYFLSFESGARIELMHKPGLDFTLANIYGLAHFAIALGSKIKVDSLTERMRSDGLKIVGEPRTTGDGYYESVVSDPEGNLIELTV